MAKRSPILVAACDDEPAELEKVGRVLERIGFEHNVRCAIRTFSSPLKLLELGPDEVDILVLDIEMPEMNGFDVAAYLRMHRSRTRIIFLTNYREYIQKAFEVRAFRYLYKPFDEAALDEALGAAVADILQSDWHYLSTPDRVRHQVHIDDILYAESLGESTAIHTRDAYYETTNPLYYWEETFGHHMFQCHKSYLVNLRNVTHVDDTRVMLGEREVPLSGRRRAKMKEALRLYAVKYAKYM